MWSVMLTTIIPMNILRWHKDILWLIPAMALIMLQTADSAVILSRRQRDLISLSMIATFKTGRTAIDFINYGRYCGVFGSGSAVDGVDQCCLNHDHCYDVTTDPGGDCEEWGKYGPYWIIYKWSFSENGTILCKHEDVNYNRFADCGYEICNCDIGFTSCLAKHSYNPNNRKTLMWRVIESELNTRFNLTTD